MSAAPLTRPSTKLCTGCHQHAPIGMFSGMVPDPLNPGRMAHVTLDTCRDCRQNRRALPGRAFR